MPVSYEIDVARRLVVSTIVGPCSLVELAAGRKLLSEDPRFSPSFASITDLTLADPLHLTAADVQYLARTSPGAPQARRAIVAAAGTNFGIARMYSTHASEDNYYFKVCLSMAEAEEWLGLSPPHKAAG